MKAVTIPAFGGPDQLRLGVVDVPQPGDGQVRIEVVAAAVNPVDLVTRAGVLHAAGLHDGAPVRLGWDVYGHVQALDAGVHRLRVGQAVIGLSDRLSAPSKTHAEQVVLDENAVAAVPAELDAATAACLPLAGSTAWQALDRLALRPGQTLLVTGASGAVGSLAAQLARLRELTVVATGRSRDRLAELFADHVVESGPGLADRVRSEVPGGVDGAIDTAGLGTAALDAVRNGGAHVSLSVTERPAPLRGIRSESLAVAADWRHLALLASLAASGALHVHVAHELPLAQARRAHELLAAGGLSGRVVLRP